MAEEKSQPCTAYSDTLTGFSAEIPTSAEVEGYDFNKGIDYDNLFKAYKTTGFQATNLGNAIEVINEMLAWRLSDEPKEEGEEEEYVHPLSTEEKIDPSNVRCTVFLGFTSNMISCGVRETLRFLCQHKMVDYIVTTGGGIEEDLMKCFTPHYIGDFTKFKGHELRKKGQNRIGNLLVPNNNYCKFEEFLMPLIKKMHEEQKETGKIWTPSAMIDRFGKEINDERSVWYWCHKNKIKVFCPAITDGSIGDMIYFYSVNTPGFIVDIAKDICDINEAAINAKKSGMIILGGGLIKHHILNANLMRNGGDYSVFINTGQEFDGSDSGAKPDEAISWGKISLKAKPVKVSGDASLIFPLVVSQTFAKYHFAQKEKEAAKASTSGEKSEKTKSQEK